jgi:predicted transcriptional regulator
MDAVYRLGKPTAAEVMAALEDAPSYSSVRTHLRILTEKGLLSIIKDGARYVYEPVVVRDDAASNTLKQVVTTFFEGSVADAVMKLVADNESELSEDELDRLAAMIENARRKQE